MKSFIFASLLSLSFVYSSEAQKLSTSDAQLNLNANFPSGKVRAYNPNTVVNLNLRDGILNIEAYNEGFQFNPALNPALKKEVQAAHQLPTSRIKAQISNLEKIDFTKEGQQPARVIGRFIYNGVSTTFYEKAQLTIEDGKITLSMSVEVPLADYDIEGAKKDAIMSVSIMATLAP